MSNEWYKYGYNDTCLAIEEKKRAMRTGREEVHRTRHHPFTLKEADEYLHGMEDAFRRHNMHEAAAEVHKTRL